MLGMALTKEQIDHALAVGAAKGKSAEEIMRDVARFEQLFAELQENGDIPPEVSISERAHPAATSALDAWRAKGFPISRCEHCQNEYEQTRTDRKYCSERCKVTAKYKRKFPVKRSSWLRRLLNR